uniref:Rab-GAP TBC domain-containing protein n=1 Tax=Parastrongyloides trichosuri TaxID=131310 RepID=A0A0N4Z206_PARTI
MTSLSEMDKRDENEFLKENNKMSNDGDNLKTDGENDSIVTTSYSITASSVNKTPKSNRRPPLSMIRTRGSVIKSADSFINTSSPSGREFVYSLHQNNKLTLLYGKNNVSIPSYDDKDKILKGYLSLHREFCGNVVVKWTPNELMNLNNTSQSTGTSTTTSSGGSVTTQTAFPFTSSTTLVHHNPIDILILAKNVISFNMKNIAYLHVHQNDDIGVSTIVFIDNDGSQEASFSFMNSSNLIQFIGTLESCIEPLYKLDPPMIENKETQEKMLPKLRKKTSNTIPSKPPSSVSDEEDKKILVNDYVFRIIVNTQYKKKLIDEKVKGKLQNCIHSSINSNSNNNNNQNSYTSFEAPKSAPAYLTNKDQKSKDNNVVINDNVTTNINNALIFMKHRILSRAFIGWLNYCKHLKAVRENLLNIVNIKSIDFYDNNYGTVNREYWEYLRKNKEDKELWNTFVGKVYNDGIDHDIRKEAWLYLLKVINWNEEIEERREEFESKYKKDKLCWLEIENIVIQRDKEAFISARMRHFNCTSGNEEDDSECNSINSHQYDGSCNFSDVFNEDIENGRINNKNNIYDDSQSLEKNQEEEDLINNFGTNLHRIEKDVERCDRSNSFFKKQNNLKKLKNIMCSYVWRNLDEGYVQGMCDIAAPLLVIFEDEVIVLECFSKLMERMRLNFPQEIGMDNNFKYLRHLVEVTDPELFSMIMAHGDFTHLYFSYRWFLLDFKRELNYEGVYKLWETIWASNEGLSKNFQLFFALSLLTSNRYIIIENSMDFTDVIKFFNDMAEKHDTQKLIDIARCHLKDFRKFIIDNCSNDVSKEE